MITITENAATMLDAMHAGCRVSLYRDDDGSYAMIEPGKVRAPRQKPGYQPKAARITVEDIADSLRASRADAWVGEPGRMPLEDAVILVRGAMATKEYGSLTITDRGRAIAQARIGDGLRIVDNTPDRVTVDPDTAFAIGEPSHFELYQMTDSEPRLTLSVVRQSIVLGCSGPEHSAEASIDSGVARTLAGFLADVGKVKIDTTASFGGVAITLTSHDDGATLVFDDGDTNARVTMSKPLAKVLRAYLLELAKKSTTPAVLEPVEVELRGIYVVDPSCLGSFWDDGDEHVPMPD